MLLDMSEMATSPAIPEWTLGDRLDRALKHGHVSVEAMAHHLDVSRSTISRWLHDRGAPPKKLYVLAWAELCNVDRDWLLWGGGSTMTTNGSSARRPIGSRQLDVAPALIAA